MNLKTCKQSPKDILNLCERSFVSTPNLSFMSVIRKSSLLSNFHIGPIFLGDLANFFATFVDALETPVNLLLT